MINQTLYLFERKEDYPPKLTSLKLLLLGLCMLTVWAKKHPSVNRAPVQRPIRRRLLAAMHWIYNRTRDIFVGNSLENDIGKLRVKVDAF
jgi:hypothetical protein